MSCHVGVLHCKSVAVAPIPAFSHYFIDQAMAEPGQGMVEELVIPRGRRARGCSWAVKKECVPPNRSGMRVQVEWRYFTIKREAIQCAQVWKGEEMLYDELRAEVGWIIRYSVTLVDTLEGVRQGDRLEATFRVSTPCREWEL